MAPVTWLCRNDGFAPRPGAVAGVYSGFDRWALGALASFEIVILVADPAGEHGPARRVKRRGASDVGLLEPVVRTGIFIGLDAQPVIPDAGRVSPARPGTIAAGRQMAREMWS